jgi:ABC-2 type transport system ATP-binding protein
MMLAVETENLRRSFRIRTGWLRPSKRVVEAVRGVDLRVTHGELFGLLGPNGAGKTTTIKMLNTLLLPTGGAARVLGHDVVRSPIAVRRRIGYVFGGDRGLYDRLSAVDNLRYFAELYGVEPREQRRRIAEVLDIVALAGRQRERVEGFSRGMRQRLHIARGLLHRPEVLFMDEPSLGVDPVAARELRRTVADLSAQGTTIILTTHYMAEAEELCDRIAIIADGRIKAQGTPAELKARLGGRAVLEIEVHGATPQHTERIRRLPGVRDATLEPTGSAQLLRACTDSGPELHRLVLDALGDVRIGRFTDRPITLEDAYVAVIGGTGPEPAGLPRIATPA